MKFELRPYQSHGIELCRDAIRRGFRRIVYYLPTGGGKTAISVALIEYAISKGKRVAFVVNRLQLLQQTSHVFHDQGIPHGIIQGENTIAPYSSVLICSIQTIAKRGIPDVDLLILDECHGVSGTKEYHKIMKTPISIGLTATPYQKGLGRNIPSLNGPLFETVVVGASMPDLTREGFLVPADVWGPPVDLTGVKTVAGEYEENSLNDAMNKPKLVGDIIQNWLRLAHGKQTMVFAVKIDHSQRICEEFKAVGIDAIHVDYKMSDDEKRTIYDDFRANKFTVLCNCALLSEGSDFPAAECLVLARPTKSKVRFTQMVGRVLRPSSGKDRAIILDHGSCFTRLGYPWDFEVGELDDGKPKKSSPSDEKSKSTPTPTPCPKCFFLRPNKGKCSSCGFSPVRQSDTEHIDGDLVQLTGKAKKPTKKQKLSEIPPLEIFSQLLSVARDRDYKHGWAAYKFKSLHGEFPPRDWEPEPTPPCPELQSWLRSENIKRHMIRNKYANK